ncbi:HNHc domain-containing protein [Mycena sanguinolenta]|uniref:HNHc domain-containing protein n=1 Tax=Mycena sanguinolenta TaxID=230812 RepID=A0A8H6XL93_9AGAR|nr:HNHc domain-containing protein [Mycena sanguinolenta]
MSTIPRLSAFDEDDEDDRQSLSSADLDGEDGDVRSSAQPAFNAYLTCTPAARFTTGSVAPRTKQKLAQLCGGRKCILTHETTPHVAIDVAHLLPRSTCATDLEKLELAFGLRYRQMHIDTTGNLEHIRCDLRRSFDHGGWFLLPELRVIKEIVEFTNARDGRTYKEVFPAAEFFKYRLVPLGLIADNIGIWRRKSLPSDTPDTSSPKRVRPPPAYDQIYPIRLYPEPDFESLPILESRANPFFVIANAGPKLRDNMNLLPPPWKTREDIMAVNSIWTDWMGRTPTPQWRAQAYVPRRRGGRRTKDASQGRHDGSPVPRRNPSQSAPGDRLARTTPDLPELDSDHQSPSAQSDLLTHDAVRSVASLNQGEFLKKWLGEDH